MFPVLVDKAVFALLRRIAPEAQSTYLPGLAQKFDLPGYAASTYQQVFVAGEYRPARPLPRGARILDLGAHLGMFSIYAARTCEAPRITAVEANPRTIPALKANLARLRRWGVDVDVLALAVSDRSGSLAFQFHASQQAHVGGTAYRDISVYSDCAEFVTVEVPCVPLADLLAEPVDFLKCDIEGAEYAALASVDLSPGWVREAVIEFHDLGRRRSEMTALLDGALERGYRIHAVGGRKWAGGTLPETDAVTVHLTA